MLNECKHSCVRAGLILATRPRAKLIATLAAIDVNERMMQSILEHGAREFEFEEDAKQSRATSDGDSDSRRSFAMLEAAFNTAEKASMFKCVFWLKDTAVWNVLIPPTERTMRIRCYIYRLLSSCQAHIATTLYRENENFPTQGFKAASSFNVCGL